MEKGILAVELFVEGYNCAQAVAMVFSDEMGMTREQTAKLASSFGGGMGRMREVCGAVSGMLMVAGMLKEREEDCGNLCKNNARATYGTDALGAGSIFKDHSSGSGKDRRTDGTETPQSSALTWARL